MNAFLRPLFIPAKILHVHCLALLSEEANHLKLSFDIITNPVDKTGQLLLHEYIGQVQLIRSLSC